MSDFFGEYTLSPSEIASLTEPTSALQRNYRLRGMFDPYGQADENGRWKYSLQDLVGIWVADRLANGGKTMDRRDALKIGAICSEDVINNYCLKHLHSDEEFGVIHYIAYLSDGDSKNKDISFIALRSLSDLESKPFDNASVIDIHHLSRTIPENIRGLLKVAAEKLLGPAKLSKPTNVVGDELIESETNAEITAEYVS